MLLISQLLLLLVCLGAAWVAKPQASRAVSSHSEYLVISLSLLAVAVALLGQITLDPKGSDSGTLLRILNNLALYAAAPMLVTAVVAIAKSYPISRPAWGRWLLGLFALFELCRRMGYGEQYTFVLGLCCLGGLLTSVYWWKQSAIRRLMLGALLLLATGFAAHYLATTALSLVLSAAGLALFALALKNAQPQPQPE